MVQRQVPLPAIQEGLQVDANERDRRCQRRVHDLRVQGQLIGHQSVPAVALFQDITRRLPEFPLPTKCLTK